MRVLGRGGAALTGAILACLLTWAVLNVALPAPLTSPPPGPVLESVTPAQLAAMGLRVESTVQPVELPGWLTSAGVRLPTTILLKQEAESVVRQNSTGVRAVAEITLTYATVTNPSPRTRGPTMFHRLAWAVVGTRAATGTGGFVQMLWLIDARSKRQLLELAVPATVPGLGAGLSGGS